MKTGHTHTHTHSLSLSLSLVNASPWTKDNSCQNKYEHQLLHYASSKVKRPVHTLYTHQACTPISTPPFLQYPCFQLEDYDLGQCVALCAFGSKFLIHKGSPLGCWLVQVSFHFADVFINNLLYETVFNTGPHGSMKYRLQQTHRCGHR